VNVLTGFSPIARAVVVMAAIAIAVTFVQAAASVIAPILLAVFTTVVALDASEQTRPLAILLGPDVEEEPETKVSPNVA